MKLKIKKFFSLLRYSPPRWRFQGTKQTLYQSAPGVEASRIFSTSQARRDWQNLRMTISNFFSDRQQIKSQKGKRAWLETETPLLFSPACQSPRPTRFATRSGRVALAGRPRGWKEPHQGFTLMELLIVIALLGILLSFLFWVYPVQIEKANDAKRKADLDRLRVSLQEYYNDNYCFPQSLECGENFSPYLEIVPCDPKTGESYRYFSQGEVDCPGWFKIYTLLGYEEDPIIEVVGCKDGCGPTGEEMVYNYGVSSSNVRVGEVFPSPSPLPSPSECPVITSCFGTICNYTTKEVCPNVYFCNDNCSGDCFTCPPEKPNCVETDPEAIPIEEKQCQ